MTKSGEDIALLSDGFSEAVSPDWSPDGMTVAFQGLADAGIEIYSIRVDGSDLAQLSDERDDGASSVHWPEWSPDGTKIAHKRIRYDAASETDSEALYLMEPDGGNIEQVTEELFFDGAPTWSPDGREIAFAGRELGDAASTIYVMDADGSNLRAVIEGGAGPEWSPDGTQIAFVSGGRDGDGEIYTAAPDGTDVVQLTDNDVHDADPAWQPVPAPEDQDDDLSPTPTPTGQEEAKPYVGFHPPSYEQDGMIVMPLTFVDGSTGEAVAPPGLGIQEMSAAIYTAGGLGGVDRTINFLYEDASMMTHEGPLETYPGSGEAPVEVWGPAPQTYGCPNLVYRFGAWIVGVRTCQPELSVDEKTTWARALKSEVTDNGFLVLSADAPLVLQETGGHEGPELILGMDRADWIELEPGPCDPKDLVDEGDVRTMGDGTRVSFSRIEDGNSGIEYDWFATWCEDGFIIVQVSYAHEDFAVDAAEGFRMRDVVPAD